MRGKTGITILVALVLLATLSACNFIETSYKTLAISRQSYDTGMMVVAQLQRDGIITQVQRDEINRVAKIFKESHNTAVNALEIYATTMDAKDKDKLIVAISLAASKWADLVRFVNAIRPNVFKAEFGK